MVGKFHVVGRLGRLGMLEVVELSYLDLAEAAHDILA